MKKNTIQNIEITQQSLTCCTVFQKGDYQPMAVILSNLHRFLKFFTTEKSIKFSSKPVIL